MGLFNFNKKTGSEKKENSKNEAIYRIPYSKGFKGFKKFPVVVYGEPETERNCKEACKKDLSKSTIEFLCTDYEGKNSKGRMALLLVDNVKVGAIFREEQLYEIEHGLIEMIHAETKDFDERLHFLVKYKEGYVREW